MEKKEDRRVMMTKRMLKDALIELLKEKDIYHISIRELCGAADVNRTTFYKYYGSQFDLLGDMENDIISFVEKTIKANESDQENVIASVCEYLENNIEFARLIINNNVDPSFAHKLIAMDSIKSNAIRKYSRSRSETELEYIYNFQTYGTFRMICMWLNKDKRETPKAFAKMIGQMLKS